VIKFVSDLRATRRPEFTPDFSGVRVARTLVLYVVFGHCTVYHFDLRLLITPVVSSSFLNPNLKPTIRNILTSQNYIDRGLS
jgi:hypothetical protein